MPLPHNDLDAFQFGANLDLRVRFAMELLKSPMFQDYHVSTRMGGVDGAAIKALNVASDLFAEAEERGLIKPLDKELNEWNKTHIRRLCEAGLFQQKENQRLHDASLKLANAVGGAFKQ